MTRLARFTLGLVIALMLFAGGTPKASAQYYRHRYGHGYYYRHAYYRHEYYRHRRWCYYHPYACR